MHRFNRRQFVAGMAGMASLAAFGMESARPSPAAAQGAFDVVAGPHGCGRVALLFNVGASYEPAMGILDTLGAYGVPATFFVMGWLAEQNPELPQQIAVWGHPVGSHGYLPPELTARSDEDVLWDLGAASSALEWSLGYHPGPWFTPFAGASDERVRSLASSQGLITVGWGVDSEDWNPAASADAIYSRVVNGIYDGAIVELHMDAQRSIDGTAVALPWILDDVLAQGYSLVTVPTMVSGC
jgi:peptidoglycan-N-acetylglucosamine deacetylase